MARSTDTVASDGRMRAAEQMTAKTRKPSQICNYVCNIQGNVMATSVCIDLILRSAYSVLQQKVQRISGLKNKKES